MTLGLAGAAFPVLATPPEVPIEIVTPEEAATDGRITTDQMRVQAQAEEVGAVRLELVLYSRGEVVARDNLEPAFNEVEAEANPDVENGGERLLVAEIPAIPEQIRQQAEDGPFALSVTARAELTQGGGEVVIQEWIRWRRTEGEVEFLDINEYSALTDEPEVIAGEEGRPAIGFAGDEAPIESPSAEGESALDTRVEEVVEPELVEPPNEEAAAFQADESDED